MSDEPNPKTGEWMMPTPIFRSTGGRTPKTAKEYIDPDDIDTAAPDFVEADTNEIDLEPAAKQKKVDSDTPHEAAGGEPNVSAGQPSRNAERRAAPPQTRGCAKTLGITTIIVFSTTVILIVLIYFLFFYGTADSTF